MELVLSYSCCSSLKFKRLELVSQVQLLSLVSIRGWKPGPVQVVTYRWEPCVAMGSITIDESQSLPLVPISESAGRNAPTTSDKVKIMPTI